MATIWTLLKEFRNMSAPWGSQHTSEAAKASPTTRPQIERKVDYHCWGLICAGHRSDWYLRHWESASGSRPGKSAYWKGLVNMATLGIRKGQAHLLLTLEEGRGGSQGEGSWQELLTTIISVRSATAVPGDVKAE